MKKIMLSICCLLLSLLTGCGALMNMYRPLYNSDAYFVTLTGKMKNPYRINDNEKKAIKSRGWKVDDEKYKYSYSSDRVGGLYNQQFIKINTQELDMDLVKSELEIQLGSETPKIEKFYLCNIDNVNDEIKEMNSLLRNNFEKLEEIVNKEVSRFVQRKDIKTEILSTRTISYNDKGRINCDNYIKLSVKILKQEDFPEITIGMNMEYVTNDENNPLRLAPDTQKAHEEILKKKINSYFQFEAKKEKIINFRNEVEMVLGKEYIFRNKNDGLKYGKNEEVFPKYYFDNGMAIQADLSDYDNATSFLNNRTKPDFSQIQQVKNEYSPEHLTIEIRPINESEIVSPEKLKELRVKIREISKKVFGYEVGIALEIYSSFRIIKTGISEQMIGFDEFYHIQA